MLHTVPWVRPNYPQQIIIDGNEIDGLCDFHCELGFLLNFNQWGYFGANGMGLNDCLRDLPKETKIIWKNYNRARIVIDADYYSSSGAEISLPTSKEDSYSEELCQLFRTYIDFERID